MKIKYMLDEDLHMCRTNIKKIYEEVVSTGRKSLNQLLDTDDALKNMAVEIKDFKLEVSDENKLMDDAKNAEIVYETMKDLTDSQAAEEKLWVAYTLSEQLEYMRKRWPVKDVNGVNAHYFFGYSPRRSLFRNGMSRLWWLGRVTKNLKYKDDPYKLTKFVCNHTDIIQFICEQPVFQKPEVMRGTISAMYEIDYEYNEEEKKRIAQSERKGVKIDKIIIQEIGKYMNLLSGTYLLDLFDENEIYDLVKKRIMKMAHAK